MFLSYHLIHLISLQGKLTWGPLHTLLTLLLNQYSVQVLTYLPDDQFLPFHRVQPQKEPQALAPQASSLKQTVISHCNNNHTWLSWLTLPPRCSSKGELIFSFSTSPPPFPSRTFQWGPAFPPFQWNYPSTAAASTLSLMQSKYTWKTPVLTWPFGDLWPGWQMFLLEVIISRPSQMALHVIIVSFCGFLLDRKWEDFHGGSWTSTLPLPLMKPWCK